MKPTRIQLSRKKGWRMPANTVRVARPSRWGNPFKVGKVKCTHPDCEPGSHGEVTPAEAVRAFRDWLTGMLRIEPKFLAPLRGKNLACWCKLGEPCHADVLLEIANAPLPHVCPDCCAAAIRSGLAHAGILCAGCEFIKRE